MLLLLACATETPDWSNVTDTGAADTANTAEVDDTAPDTAPEATWAAVFAVLQAQCFACHMYPAEASNGALVLSADAQSTYVTLTQATPTLEGWAYVMPGDLEKSLLVDVVGDDPASGMAMPPYPRLADEDRALIEAWVLAGAPQ